MDRGVLFTFTVTLLLFSNFVSNWPLRRLHFGLARPLFDLFYLEHNAGKYKNAQLRFRFLHFPSLREAYWPSASRPA